MKTEHQPPREYKTLDDLFAQALHYAEHFMHSSGRAGAADGAAVMLPAFFVLSEDGPPAFFIYSAARDAERWRSDLNELCGMFALIHAATASVIVLETWTTKEPRAPESGEKISEALDRVEVITMIGETRASKPELRMYPIIRHGNKKFYRLDDNRAPDPERGRAGGMFATLLPEETAPKAIREMAQIMFEGRGFKIGGVAPRGKA